MQPRLSIQILPLESQILLSLIIYFGFVAQIASATPEDWRRDGYEEQTEEKVPHHELEGVQRGAEGARALAMDMAGPGDAM